jgi:hypothetical protein
VVHREAQSQGDHEVDGEHRDPCLFAGDPQAEQRRGDRQRAGQQRQYGGDEAAEEQQQQREEDREGDQLRAPQVGLDRAVDLDKAHPRAAERDPAAVLEVALDAGRRIDDLMVGQVPEAPDDVGRAAVPGAMVRSRVS